MLFQITCIESKEKSEQAFISRFRQVQNLNHNLYYIFCLSQSLGLIKSFSNLEISWDRLKKLRLILF